MKILRGYGFHSMKPSVLFEMEIGKTLELYNTSTGGLG